MLTKNDQNKIREIIQDETEGMRLSLVNIEQDRKILKDIWEFIKDHTHKLKNHEERISNLESS
ncbi:hypothetical protein HY382_01190 [Candidatus Curtissbacteria bacterium]|nr:hypothetical protein [Candidatus Curtissbacteria bacterium]